MHACMPGCTHVCMYVRMDGWMDGRMDGCMPHVCMYVCTYVCMCRRRIGHGKASVLKLLRVVVSTLMPLLCVLLLIPLYTSWGPRP